MALGVTCCPGRWTRGPTKPCLVLNLVCLKATRMARGNGGVSRGAQREFSTKPFSQGQAGQPRRQGITLCLCEASGWFMLLPVTFSRALL